MKIVLITGINGFLGSHLAISLSKKYNIIGLEYNLKNLVRIKNLGLRVYSSSDDLENIFRENDVFAIIHAATIYRRDIEPIETLIKTNILLPINLFELANKYHVKLFLNTDTFFNNSKYNYSYLPDYTLSKKHVIEWLLLIQKSTKLINMKIFHMYGPNDSLNKFIPSVISKLKNNEPFLDTTPGKQTRDFIYIDDVASAYESVLGFSHPNNNFNEFMIGTGNSISIKDLLLIIKDITGSKTIIRFGNLSYRENEIMESDSNISELKKIGWTSRFTIAEGIKKTISQLI